MPSPNPTHYPLSEYHDLFQPLATIIGSVVSTFLVGYYFTYKYNVSKTRLEITKSCITEYRKIISDNRKIHQENILPFLALIAEELYYMKKGYILKDVAIEWLKGMIDYMPIYKLESKNDITNIVPINAEAITNSLKEAYKKPINYQPYIVDHHQNLIYFPRIYPIFILNKSFFKDLKKLNYEADNFFNKVYPVEFTYKGLQEKDKIKNLIVKHLWRNIKNYSG